MTTLTSGGGGAPFAHGARPPKELTATGLTAGAGLGSHVHGNKDPNKKCWITGILPKTSPVAYDGQV